MHSFSLSIRSSIAAQLLAIVFSIYFLITLTVTLLHMAAEFYDTREHIIQEMNVVEKVFNPILAGPIWQMDHKALQYSLSGIMSNPILVGIKVADNNDDIHFEMGKIIDPTGHLKEYDSYGKPIQGTESTNVLTQLFKKEFIITYHENGEFRSLGRATLYSSNKIVLNKLRLGYLFIILNAIIKTVSLWIIFLWVSRRLLSKPLMELTNATHSIEMDNLEKLHVQVKTQGQNELKILENGFNIMINKLFMARESIKFTMRELDLAKSRLEILLEGTRGLVSTHDKFHAMVSATNTLCKIFNSRLGGKVNLYFQEQDFSGKVGFVNFQIPISHIDGQRVELLLTRIHQIVHTHSETLPERYQNILNIPLQFPDLISNQQLLICIRHDSEILGIIDLDIDPKAHWDSAEAEFIDTFTNSLAVTLESINFTINLEKIIHERTKELKVSLTAEEEISQSLLTANMELVESRQLLEKQNSVLQASNSKLEEMDSTKTILLTRLNTMYDNDFHKLQSSLQELLHASVIDSKDIIRDCAREILKIDEFFRPIKSLYLEEKAIRNKKVLLADNNPKQQMVAKLALGGTGADLTMVNTIEQGKALLLTTKFDVVCVNSELVELSIFAQQNNPDVQTVFMTSDSMQSYLQVLQKYSLISNIVTRSENDRTFTIKNILTTVSKLVSRDLFGLEKYLNWGVDVRQFNITKSADRTELIKAMEQYLTELGLRKTIINKCALIGEELLMNAIYDAPTDSDGHPLYNHLPRTVPVILKSKEQGQLRFASDGMLVAISAVDPFGALSRQTIIDYLSENLKGQAGLQQKSLHKGGAGRGLYQIMETCDLMVVNVKPLIRTEVIVLLNIDPDKAKIERSNSFHYFYG